MVNELEFFNCLFLIIFDTIDIEMKMFQFGAKTEFG